MNVASSYFQRKNRRKIEPKETPSCLIPCLCVVLTWQLEILVTTLTIFQSRTCCVCIAQFFKINRAVNSLCNFLFPCQGPITLITDNLPANFPGFPIDRRAQVALELYTTERSYVRSLETILQVWIDELITVRVRKNAKFGVFYAEIVQMTPLRLRRESLQLQKFSVTNRAPATLTPEIFGSKHSFVLTFFATSTIYINCKHCKP